MPVAVGIGLYHTRNHPFHSLYRPSGRFYARVLIHDDLESTWENIRITNRCERNQNIHTPRQVNMSEKSTIFLLEYNIKMGRLILTGG